MKPIERYLLVSFTIILLGRMVAIPSEPSFTEEDRAYWAYQPVRDPVIPPVKQSAWLNNPIDAFILKKLEDAGIQPSPQAIRPVLIRRVSLNLTGLPPSPEEIEAFSADPDPDAYLKLVERLLASPRYGEYWGRYWLNLVRYSDSNGFKSDEYRPVAWKYRDYVIKTFNDDKPYHQFVTEQLAGDECEPDNPQSLVATGFLRLWPYESNQRDVDRQWADILNELTNVSGEVFLGMSIGCARCHDHKFDPILQKDYFRLRSFFASVFPADDIPDASASEKGDYNERLDRWLTTTRSIREKLEEIEHPARKKAEDVSLLKFDQRYQKILGAAQETLTPYQQQIRKMANLQLQKEHANVKKMIRSEEIDQWNELRKKLKTYDPLKPTRLPTLMAVRDIGPIAPKTHIPGKPSDAEIQPGYPSILDPFPAVIRGNAEYENSTGRRLTLARWITHPDNPLTPRVLVNRIWHHHFEAGLVKTPNDFGRQGHGPSHPELLDWLARKFLQGNGSIKNLHRLILTSAVYLQSALNGKTAVEPTIDPENRLLWRMPVRRLTAEQIRDSILKVSGNLDLQMHGEGRNYDSYRRSVYLKFIRNTREQFVEAFDGSDGFNSMTHQTVTTTAPQSLLLLNGKWTFQQSRFFVERIDEMAGLDSAAAIQNAYRMAYGRSPTQDELQKAEEFLKETASEIQYEKPSANSSQDGKSIMGKANRSAMIDFCQMLLNSNEFLYVQ